jgi:hypothetical protein
MDIRLGPGDWKTSDGYRVIWPDGMEPERYEQTLWVVSHGTISTHGFHIIGGQCVCCENVGNIIGPWDYSEGTAQ